MVISVDLPPGSGSPEPVRSFAACLAAVTETPVGELPLPPTDLAGALAHWRSWLAGRGLGLAPVARPRQFAWPGYWLAVTCQASRSSSSQVPKGIAGC